MKELTVGAEKCGMAGDDHKAMIKSNLQSVCPAAPAGRDGGCAVGRVWAGAVALGCLAILFGAAWLNPSPAGIGTHEQLGLPACGFYERTGYPCPTCGMTTALAYIAHGQVFRALAVQPAGALLGLACLAGVIGGCYTAATGRGPKLGRLWINPVRTVFLAGMVVMTSWLWLCLLTYLRQH